MTVGTVKPKETPPRPHSDLIYDGVSRDIVQKNE